MSKRNTAERIPEPRCTAWMPIELSVAVAAFATNMRKGNPTASSRKFNGTIKNRKLIGKNNTRNTSRPHKASSSTKHNHRIHLALLTTPASLLVSAVLRNQIRLVNQEGLRHAAHALDLYLCVWKQPPRGPPRRQVNRIADPEQRLRDRHLPAHGKIREKRQEIMRLDRKVFGGHLHEIATPHAADRLGPPLLLIIGTH